jgi:hypothetical protein
MSIIIKIFLKRSDTVRLQLSSRIERITIIFELRLFLHCLKLKLKFRKIRVIRLFSNTII